jgi:hypothetical protein
MYFIKLKPAYNKKKKKSGPLGFRYRQVLLYIYLLPLDSHHK